MPSSRCIAVVCLFLAVAFIACKEIPTSVLLRVEAAPGLPLADELRLTVIENKGVAASEQRLPPSGPPSLPNTAVLYPASAAGTIRLRVLAKAGGVVVGSISDTRCIRHPHHRYAT